MKEQHYRAIARAVNERRLESRNVAQRKVVELAADIADVLASADPGFILPDFYRRCGFTAEDMQLVTDRGRIGAE